MSDSQKTMTRTVESGAFIRTTTRYGKKRKQKTTRITKNQKKVVLGFIGDFEVYVYPYDYPDVAFIGKFPTSVQINADNVRQLFSCFNKIRAYLNGNYFSEPNSRKATNSRRHDIQTAYNHALNEKRTKKKA